ncbi:hypothetical protein [Stakelama marina]|uniref:Uncharacterized protein n=1 Tax=Stakelama marina TaxID=2826939 RepID=A0A8T4IIE0_9SPHN|nr:hypothetical protein [Stakelama marina]MBR0553654.1 hypothetical protein [Stakelama marina]
MGKEKKKAKKLPKYIGGVKIPKEIRKKGGKLLAQVDTPMARELMAAGLIAAGTAMAKRHSERRAERERSERESSDGAGRGESPEEMGARVAGQAMGIAGAAMTAAFDRIFGQAGPPRPPEAPEPPQPPQPPEPTTH